MSWQNAISEAAYTSHSGKRQTFRFESVSRETDLKTATFTFPGKDGALVQSLGVGGRRFPLTCYFSGAQCMKEADDFEALLREKGSGRLSHPVYGTVTVIPTGTIKRSDDLIAGLNQSVVDVTFTETLDMSFPESEIAREATLQSALGNYEDVACAAYVDMLATDKISDKLKLQSTLKAELYEVNKGTEKLIKQAPALSKKNILSELSSLYTQVTGWIGSVDKVAKYAMEIAAVTLKIIKLPSTLAIGAEAKIEGYRALSKNIMRAAGRSNAGAGALRNRYASTSLVLSALSAHLAAGTALTDNDYTRFTSRSGVLRAATGISEQFENYKTYVDAETARNIFVASDETYECVLRVVSAATHALLTKSYSLPTTRIVTLDRDRQIVELVASLYGADGFNKIDDFINDNALTADEIVVIPAGREIRYYV